MKAAWRSLRLRLVASYLGLALLLLVITGFVFSALINSYADMVHRQQVVAYVVQVQEIMADARAAQLSPDEVERRFQRQLPALKIERIPFGTGEAVRLLPSYEEPQIPNLRLLTFRVTRDEPTSALVLPYPQTGLAPTLFRFSWPTRSAAVLRSLTGQVLVVLGLAFGLAALVGWWLSRWLSRPLSRLTAATAAVARGDFLQTVHPPGITELDGLVEQFNTMVLSVRDGIRSLQAERDVAKRFAGDAAHELQTPTAALRAYHDVVAERPERLAQVLPALQRQVERMERVIAGLLEMAALGEDTGIALVPGDAGELVRRLEPVLSDLSDEYGHTLAVRIEDGALPVRLDPRLLELALTNLVDNACKYTAGAAEIALLVRREGTQAAITVADPGPGIPAGELPFIFERFRRGIATQGTPGAGLGLAIVTEAVQRMGGTVAAESVVGQGSRFTIRLPLAT